MEKAGRGQIWGGDVLCPQTDEEVNKQNVLHTDHGILFSLEREWNSDTCYNGDEP